MKISDLRAQLKYSSPDVLTSALVEVYKAVSKEKKEELDPVLTDILAGVPVSKKYQKLPAPALAEVMDEIDEFLANAREEYYTEYNRDHPRWHYLVMRFIKVLKSADPADPNFARSGEYLLSLFQLLAEGCTRYIFSSNDPFASIQTPQEELFSLVAARTLECQGCSEESLTTLFWTAVSCGTSQSCMHYVLIMQIIDLLTTQEERRLALKTVKQLIADQEQALPGDGPYEYNRDLYAVLSGIQELNRAVLWIAVLLDEMKDEIPYYFKHGHEGDLETTLYYALFLFEHFGWCQTWVTLYEYAVRTLKVTPIGSCRMTYPRMKQQIKARTQERAETGTE